ncbi:MAG: hypothetical protein C7B45_10665 [Sulfobacillus acidophilus]|uniref:Uncharacterized protein n=1 Tax=Sulfobacillus acidophilus TaxID=53633 RepID=A0A2T2WGX8_9FIRM|nr:MAG: hypothetical protein C7B45_10665 [Sulfobacillus acidophilus]
MHPLTANSGASILWMLLGLTVVALLTVTLAWVIKRHHQASQSASRLKAQHRVIRFPMWHARMARRWRRRQSRRPVARQHVSHPSRGSGKPRPTSPPYHGNS